MANLFDLKDVKNNVHRSGFDLSERVCFTAKIGEILPITWSEIIPNDLVNIDLRQFMRTAPIQTASFGRVRQYYDFYFIPYRLLWDKFPAWVVQTLNPYHAKDIKSGAILSDQHPYFTTTALKTYLTAIGKNKSFMDNGNDRLYGTNKLLNMLGYGNQSRFYADPQEYALNPFPLLAYQKIYQDFFRFAQWEKAAPWTYNLDYILEPQDLELDLASMTPSLGSYQKTFLDLQSCNFDKDYFLGILPEAQFGSPAIASPIVGDLSGNLNIRLLTSDTTTSIGLKSSTGGNPALATTMDMTVTNAAEFKLDNDTTAGLSILAIRYAQAAQKWAEITQSGDPDYRTQLQKHWNVDPGPDQSYRCEYLGGISADLDIQGVDNTNLTDSDSLIRGKGLSANSGHIEFKTKDYGILMCVYHSKPLHEYNATTIMNKSLLKTKTTDYAIPEFDSIGMQTVLAGESSTTTVLATDPVGYVPRYAEYKSKYDTVHGAFETTLIPWTLPYTFFPKGNQAFNYTNFKVPYNFCDNMFGLEADATVDTDQFYCTAFFKQNFVRSLSRDGLPY